MSEIFLMLVIWHSDVGHLNSQGVAHSVSFTRMESASECEQLKPVFIATALSELSKLNGATSYCYTERRPWRGEPCPLYTVTAKCMQP